MVFGNGRGEERKGKEREINKFMWQETIFISLALVVLIDRLHGTVDGGLSLMEMGFDGV